jgi:hypothetical protein
MMSSAMASTAIIVIIGLIAFLSAVGTKSVSSETTNPIRFESLLDNWFPVKVSIKHTAFVKKAYVICDKIETDCFDNCVLDVRLLLFRPSYAILKSYLHIRQY